MKVTHGYNYSLEEKKFTSALIVPPRGKKGTINDLNSQITQANLPYPQSTDRLRKLGDRWQAPPSYST